uniref:Putative lipocalin lipocalin n=1 Tax=Rhipicephalus microplus TaxID=6941 RepID=A0A6G5A5A7_RHIMP
MGAILTRPVSICEMKRFVNTSERIWTVKSTNPAHVSCLFDIKRSINQGFIIYNRTFYFGRRRSSVPLRGVFHTGDPSWMITTTLDRLPYSIESFLYTNWNCSCAVVKVLAINRGRIVYYDLRVRNSSVKFNIDLGCKRQFHWFAGLGKLIYTSKCQRILYVEK